MNTETKVFIYIDALERFRFFKRLSVGRGELTFITHLLSVKILSILLRVRCILVTCKNTEMYLNGRSCALDDYVNNESINCDLIYGSIYQKSLDFLSENKKEKTLCFVWNGQRIFQKAFADAAISLGLEIRYFEITNLPGKIQVDPEGTNAQSSLSRKVKVLNEKPYPKAEWEKWKANYRKVIDSKPVGQVKILKKVNYFYFIDLVGVLFFRCLKVENKSIKEKIVSKLKYKKLKVESDPLPENFAFFPLQVSTDSQVIINYDKDLFQAVVEAKRIADEKGIDLVVKPHPAETNVDFLAKFMKRKKEVGFRISNNETSEIIAKSNVVITINSTVGLESMLLGKNVIFLGESIYKNINENGLSNLILSEYRDINYFGMDSIEIKDVV